MVVFIRKWTISAEKSTAGADCFPVMRRQSPVLGRNSEKNSRIPDFRDRRDRTWSRVPEQNHFPAAAGPRLIKSFPCMVHIALNTAGSMLADITRAEPSAKRTYVPTLLSPLDPKPESLSK